MKSVGNLDNPFELQGAGLDILVDQPVLRFCFRVCRDGDRLRAPIPRIAVSRDIRDVMERQEIPESLHRGFIIGHDHIYEQPVFGEPVPDRYREAATDPSGRGDNEYGQQAVSGKHVFNEHEVDEIRNSHRQSGKQTAVPLNQNRFRG